jgi:hypothetical protein
MHEPLLCFVPVPRLPVAQWTAAGFLHKHYQKSRSRILQPSYTIQKSSIPFATGKPGVLTEGLRMYPQYLQGNTVIVPW